MARAPGTWLLAIVLALVTAVPSAAQSGGLAGKVTAADGGKPVADAVVTVQLANGAIVARGSTHADGSYRLLSVAAGTYLVRVSAIGYAPREFPGTRVGAGGTVSVNAALEVRPAIVEELVTTVSKVPEKRTDAPASAFVITTEEVAERPALSVADHLRSVPGVDISQGGLAPGPARGIPPAARPSATTGPGSGEPAAGTPRGSAPRRPSSSRGATSRGPSGGSATRPSRPTSPPPTPGSACRPAGATPRPAAGTSTSSSGTARRGWTSAPTRTPR